MKKKIKTYCGTKGFGKPLLPKAGDGLFGGSSLFFISVKLFITDVAAENADAIWEGFTEKLKFPLLCCCTNGCCNCGGGVCCCCCNCDWLCWGAMGAGLGAVGAWRTGLGLAGRLEFKKIK